MINKISISLLGSNSGLAIRRINDSINYATTPSFQANPESDSFATSDENLSIMRKERLAYRPILPATFSNGIDNLSITTPVMNKSLKVKEEIRELFPHTADMNPVEFKKEPKILGRTMKISPPKKVGVLLSGGPAPGGHNVISGIYDALKSVNPEGIVYGFKKGPDGLVKKDYIELNDKIVDRYRNTGGFDMLQSSRKKIESEEDKMKTLNNCKALGIDTLIIIGGDDSNTNAAVLTEFFKENGEDIKVIGCPKTIDGDLKNEYIDTSFGFDTATKVYSNLISNLQTDSVSSNKYWHFVKLMGRSASNVTLECALQTHPNVALISEEVAAKEMSLEEVVESIVKVIVARSKDGKDYGSVLIPEGLMEFIPEFKYLIDNINEILAEEDDKNQQFKKILVSLPPVIREKMSEESNQYINGVLQGHERKFARFRQIFDKLPESIKEQILQGRDDHGNVPLSIIQTDELLMALVKNRLDELKADGKYKGKFTAIGHFFGYEGRCDFPSNFDANYGYALGYNSIALATAGLTGYISTVNNLKKPAKEWRPGGAPFIVMLDMERRKGQNKPVIKKSLVDLNGKPFKMLESNRETWALGNEYRTPGAIQYKGKSSNISNFTVMLS